MHEADEAFQEALAELSVEAQHQLIPEVERRINEHIKETLEARSEPLVVENKPKVHYQYYEPSEGTGGLPAVICTCGQKKHHLRFKVLQRWSEKHFDKTGHNTNAKK